MEEEKKKRTYYTDYGAGERPKLSVFLIDRNSQSINQKEIHAPSQFINKE